MLALLDRLPFCSTVRTLVKVFIVKSAAVGTSYLYDFTYDLFLPDHLWTFRKTWSSTRPNRSIRRNPRINEIITKMATITKKIQNKENIESKDGNMSPTIQ